MASNRPHVTMMEEARVALAVLLCQIVRTGHEAWRASPPLLTRVVEDAVTASLLPELREAGRRSGRVTAIVRSAAVDTPEISAGRADPRTAPQPDLLVFVSGCGQPAAAIECKWVERPAPRQDSHDRVNYVRHGMKRFSPGELYAGLAPVTMMLGYLVDAGRVPRWVRAINGQVQRQLQPSDLLAPNATFNGHPTTYQSGTTRPLQHLFLEVPPTLFSSSALVMRRESTRKRVRRVR